MKSNVHAQSGLMSLFGAKAETVSSAMVAALLGVFILYGVGFSPAEAAHNAAHDGRHSMAFPCH